MSKKNYIYTDKELASAIGAPICTIRDWVGNEQIYVIEAPKTARRFHLLTVTADLKRFEEVSHRRGLRYA